MPRLAPLLEPASRVLVVEHNHGAQLCRYLRSRLPQCAFESLALPGPGSIQPRDIFAALEIAAICEGHSLPQLKPWEFTWPDEEPPETS